MSDTAMLDREEIAVRENMGLVNYFLKGYRHRRDFEDLFQLACIGLLLAVRKHDPERGSLSTVAKHYIRSEISHHVTTGKRLKRKDELGEVSLFTPLPDDEGSLIDILPDSASPATPDLIEAKEVYDITLSCPALDSREKKILRFVSLGMTHKEIGENLDISRERVRQLFDRAIEKARRYLSS